LRCARVWSTRRLPHKRDCRFTSTSVSFPPLSLLFLESQTSATAATYLCTPVTDFFLTWSTSNRRVTSIARKSLFPAVLALRCRLDVHTDVVTYRRRSSAPPASLSLPTTSSDATMCRWAAYISTQPLLAYDMVRFLQPYCVSWAYSG
jgi:hypothetical protein